MSEWKEVKLAKFLDIKHGFAFPGSGITEEKTNHILVTPGNFNIGGGFKSMKLKYFKGNYPEEYVLKADDLVVTMTDLSQETDTLGFSAKIPHNNDVNYLHNQRIGLIKLISNEVNKDFIYWLMRTKEYQSFIVSSAGGTAIMHTSPSRIKEYSCLIPPLQEQKRIAEVLSSLDDKIDLLHRNNKTLEDLAETLFRQWFVEEAEETILDKEFDVVMGQSPPGNTYNENKDGIIFFQGRTDFGFRFPTPRIFCTQPSRFANKFDTLMSVRAPVGDLNYADGRCCIGRGVAAIRHKNKGIHHSYTYYLMKHLRSDFDVHEDTGTIFGSINKDELLNIKCPKLDINNISYFNSSIGSLDDKLVSNCKQIQQLEKLRDTLLPKLMSGAVRVEN